MDPLVVVAILVPGIAGAAFLVALARWLRQGTRDRKDARAPPRVLRAPATAAPARMAVGAAAAPARPAPVVAPLLVTPCVEEEPTQPMAHVESSWPGTQWPTAAPITLSTLSHHYADTQPMPPEHL